MIARNKWNVNILLEAPSSVHWWNTIYDRSIIELNFSGVSGIPM